MDKTTDTEALKALVERRIPAALKRITDGHGLMRVPAEDTDPDLVLADCKIALERMLASQGEPLAWAVTYMGEIINVSVYLRKEDAEIDLNNRNARMPEYAKERGIIPLYSAPLPEARGAEDETVDAEAAARELFPWPKGREEPKWYMDMLKDRIAIIRKHLRPTQQTEGASAAPQAEGEQ